MGLKPIYSFLKFLDQPTLVHRLGQSVPVLLPLGGLAYTANDVYKAPEGEKAKRLVKTGSVMLFTLLAAWQSFRRFGKPNLTTIRQDARFVFGKLKEEGIQLSKSLSSLLQKAENGKVLNPLEVHTLRKELHAASPHGKAHFLKLIPDPENEAHELSFKKILHEVKQLSLMGLYPVLGGIAGGVLGNLINRDDWRHELKNQAKEGLFQYMANIALCNVGATIALLGLKQTRYIGSRAARMGAMTLGIGLVGIVFGSSIANFLGKNFFNPLFDEGPGHTLRRIRDKVAREGWGSLFRDLNSERHPELMDVALHVDDFATMGVLAGLKWVEPALPFLYSLSGFRSGIGYRNGPAASGSSSASPATFPVRSMSALAAGSRNSERGFGIYHRASAPFAVNTLPPRFPEPQFANAQGEHVPPVRYPKPGSGFSTASRMSNPAFQMPQSGYNRNAQFSMPTAENLVGRQPFSTWPPSNSNFTPNPFRPAWQAQ
ncbi:MAG TPA: hypothetical protein V6C52_10040 [Coleofasciculaceae cyanobacterium]|jgi:hypothetical protein